jgi:hypothetical protein
MKFVHLTLSSTVLSLILLMVLMFSLRLGQSTTIVGVKVGDWVKYSVTSMGAQTIWGDFYDKALWIKVEVQNVSATNLTLVETRHLQDGTDRTITTSWDLSGPDPWPINVNPPHIMPANSGPGDVVEQCDIWQITDGKWVNVELTLNYSDLRDYGGVTREVTVLEFSHCLQYYEFIANFSHKIFWDKETGFMLETIDQRTFLGYEESPDTVRLNIADTNMWDFKTGQFFPWQWFIVGVDGLIGIAAIGTVILKNQEKQKQTYKKTG